MRMGFGLISLLMSVAIILYMMVGSGGTNGPGYLGSVAKTNKQLKQQVNVIGGYDPDRQILATDSVHYHIERSGGRPKLIVSEVMAGGPMEEHYGLLGGDRILEIGSLDVNDNVSGIDDATAFLHDTYARNGPLVVMRGNVKLTLPTPEHVAAIAERDRKAALARAAANARAVPTAPPSATEDERGLIGKGLDAIRSK